LDNAQHGKTHAVAVTALIRRDAQHYSMLHQIITAQDVGLE
jgi:hypothetical protein